MWGDLVAGSMLTDEDFKRLASDLESGRVSLNQVRAAVLEAKIGRHLDAARYGNYETFLQNCSGRKNAEVFNQLHYEMGKSDFNACDGCSKITSFYANDTIAEQICEDHTCPIWIENHPERKNRRVKTITIEALKKKKHLKIHVQAACSENTMIGQNRRGLVFLSITTIAKNRVARCGAVCGGETTTMGHHLWISSR